MVVCGAKNSHGFTSQCSTQAPLVSKSPTKARTCSSHNGNWGTFWHFGSRPTTRAETNGCLYQASVRSCPAITKYHHVHLLCPIAPSLRESPGRDPRPRSLPLPPIPSLPVIVPSGPVPPLGLRRAVGREGQLFRARELWYLGGPGPEVAPPGCGTSGPHPQQGLLPSALTSNLHLCGQSHRREGCRPQRSLGWVCARLNLNFCCASVR